MKNSKHKEIEKHLLQGQSITGLMALELYGVYRLSSVINRLRAKGLPIETIIIEREDGTTYGEYIIPRYARK